MTTWNLQLLRFRKNYKGIIGVGPAAYIALKHPSDTLKWKEGKNEFEFKTLSP